MKYHRSGSSGSSGAPAGPASGALGRSPLLPVLWYFIHSCSLPYVIYNSCSIYYAMFNLPLYFYTMLSTTAFNFFDIFEKLQINVFKYVHIYRKNTLNLIETLKTSIYTTSTPKTPNYIFVLACLKIT